VEASRGWKDKERSSPLEAPRWVHTADSSIFLHLADVLLMINGTVRMKNGTLNNQFCETFWRSNRKQMQSKILCNA
jgi:hypothetical protein